MIPDRNQPAETPTSGDRGELWRRSLVGAGVGLALFVGGVGGFLLARNAPQHRVAIARTPASTTVDAAPGSAQRQTAAHRLATLAVADFSPFDPVRDEAHGFVGAIMLAPPYETVNSGIFDTAEHRIRLTRIRPIGRNEVCFDRAQFRFACGLMGRAALQNALAGRAVVCRTRFEIAMGNGRAFAADCGTEAGDLAEGLVRSGYALPAETDDLRLAAALAEAQAARRGVWAGPYVEAQADPTAEDESDVPFVGARGREAPSGPPVPPDAAVSAPTSTDLATAGGRADPSGPPPRAAARPPVREKPRRAADPPARRPPSLEELAPNASQPGGVNVVAGPIQPPSPELARRLGVAVPTAPSETNGAESSSNR